MLRIGPTSFGSTPMSRLREAWSRRAAGATPGSAPAGQRRDSAVAPRPAPVRTRGLPGAPAQRPVGSEPAIKEVRRRAERASRAKRRPCRPASARRALRAAPIATLEVIGGGLLEGRELFRDDRARAPRARRAQRHGQCRGERIRFACQTAAPGWRLVCHGRGLDQRHVRGRSAHRRRRSGWTRLPDLRLGGVKLTFEAVATEPATGPRGATRNPGAARPEVRAAFTRAPRPARGPGTRCELRRTGVAGRADQPVAARSAHGRAPGRTTGSESRPVAAGSAR